MPLPKWREEMNEQLASLQEKIEDLQNENQQLQMQLDKINAVPNNPESREDYWKSECSYWKRAADYKRYFLFSDSALLEALLTKKTKQILEDNKNLLKQHDGAYWIGITSYSGEKNLEKLESENKKLILLSVRLQDKLNYLRDRNYYLDRLFARYYQVEWEEGEQEDEYYALPDRRGRPRKIKNNSEAAEAINYRRKGWTIREIANKMGWSTGLTQNTVGNIEVPDTARKQHKAERKAATKKKEKG